MNNYDNVINNEFTMTGFSVDEQDVYNKLSTKVARSVTDPNVSDLQIYLALVAIVMTANGISIEDMYKEIGVYTASDPALRSMAMLVGYKWDNALPTEYNRTRLMFYMYRRKSRGTIPSIKNLIRTSAGEEEFYSNSLSSDIEVIEGRHEYTSHEITERSFVSTGPSSGDLTINKTFPIDVFKGGRNILPISNVVPHSRVQNVMGYFNGRENTIKSSRNFTEDTASWGLEDGQVYTFVCDICTLDDMTWLSRNFYVNSITNGQHNVTKTNAMEWTRLEVTFTYKTGGSTNVLHIYPNPQGSTYYLSNQKIIKGVNLEEPYSPAPEDGYGYDGPNPSLHVTSKKGNGWSQIRTLLSNSRVDPLINQSIRVHDFNKSSGSVIGLRSGSPYKYDYTTNYPVESSEVLSVVDSNVLRMELGSNTDMDFIMTDYTTEQGEYHGEYIRVVIPDHLLIMRVDIDEVRPAGTILEFLLRIIQKILLAKAKVLNDEAQYSLIYQAGNYYSEYIHEWDLDRVLGDLFNRPLEMYSLTTAHNDTHVRLRGVMKNLINSDFSDFTPYQGATVTRNKTFPIDVFKGGRNLWLVTDNMRLYSNNSTVYPMEYQSMGDYHRIRNTSQNGEFQHILSTYSRVLYNGISEGTEITETIEVRPKVDATIRMGGTEFTDMVCKANEWTTIRIVRVLDSSKRASSLTSLEGSKYPTNEWLDYRLRKVIIGNNPNEPYSPAPEDGYGYTGSDGAWHIQTSGGANNLKCLRNTGVSKLDVTYQNKVNIVAWENMRVGNNFRSTTPLKLNELNEIVQVSKGNGNTLLFMTFQTLKPSDSLDFIASDLKILVEIDPDTGEILPPDPNSLIVVLEYDDDSIDITYIDPEEDN